MSTRQKNLSIALTSFLLFSALPTLADVGIGQPAPDFNLTDTSGAAHKLSDYKGKFVVLEWTNPDCPFVKKHYGSGNMQGLQKELTGKGAVWLSINSSAEGKQGNYPSDKWQEIIKERGIASTAVLLDPDGKVGKEYGAKTTPHMFMVSPEGSLIYEGAIDDTPSTDPGDIASAKNYVKAAFEEASSGKPVTEAATQSYGCSVKY